MKVTLDVDLENNVKSVMNTIKQYYKKILYK